MKVAFVSCTKIQAVSQQAVWGKIRAADPDVLLMLGDNVYLDGHFQDGNPAKLRQDLEEKYDAQLAEPGLRDLLNHLRAKGGQVSAIWDDHDFLGDNTYGADASAVLRDTAREVFHAKLPYSTNPPHVYHAFDRGNVRLIMLDVRYYRRTPRDGVADVDGLLGAAQRQWLEAQLSHNQTFTLICSGTTFYKYGLFNDSWKDYRAARRHLLSLVKDRAGVLILSGDIHDNKLRGRDGVPEAVSSAGARRERENWGLLSFDQQGVSIQLSGLKASDNLAARLELSDWHLRD